MKRIISMLGALTLMFALSVGAAWAQSAASISAKDQSTNDRTVMVERVVSSGPGFVVIHESKEDGTFGAVIGNKSVPDGESMNVAVMVDRDLKDGEKLWAMLHTDTGEVGVYEFGTVEGADGPVAVDGDVVMAPFMVAVATAATTESAPATLPQSGAAPTATWPLLAMLVGLALLGSAAYLRPRLR